MTRRIVIDLHPTVTDTDCGICFHRCLHACDIFGMLEATRVNYLRHLDCIEAERASRPEPEANRG